MTKADLIEEVSRVVEMTRKESEVIVEAIFDSIVRSLRSGDKIEIRGFGSFRTRQRQPRIGRNPKTGARVEVPAKKIPYFKPSKELKDVVNNSAAPGGALTKHDGAPASTPDGAAIAGTTHLERRAIEEALRRTGGVITEAAHALHITRRMLRYKMDKLSITTGRAEEPEQEPQESDRSAPASM